MQQPRRRAARAKTAPHMADRLFVAGCTAIYALLVAAVLVALRIYGG
ncbi:MAG TPA: hypothetical protein VHW60_16455 [Caulobacteraceae bacterium]|jgi:hypothetical protein|nr:hypothetical protein [Caulobacteraceae bacterium]